MCNRPMLCFNDEALTRELLDIMVLDTRSSEQRLRAALKGDTAAVNSGILSNAVQPKPLGVTANDGAPAAGRNVYTTSWVRFSRACQCSA